MSKQLSDKEINEQAEQGSGKSRGWPSSLKYNLDKGIVTVSLPGKGIKKNARLADPWGLAFFDHCRNEAQTPPSKLLIAIPDSVPEGEEPKLEALRRRLSYLNWGKHFKNNGIQLLVEGNNLQLYSRNELMNRPEDEVIRTDFKERGDDDTPGRLEKDFQTYLFGKGKNVDDRTNERLAILGDDFRDLNKKGRTCAMEREFPTGVFRGEKSQNSRILPTDYIDMVSFNKWRILALIELKVNDSKLEVISQSIDYALFFFAYWKQLSSLLKDKLNWTSKNKKFMLYIANNCFHPKFDSVADYYSAADKNVPFEIKKVVLGHTTAI